MGAPSQFGSRLPTYVSVDLVDGDDGSRGTDVQPLRTLAYAEKLFGRGSGELTVKVGGAASGVQRVGRNAFQPDIDASSTAIYPYWLGDDGTRLFSAKGLSLRFSDDNGDTWTVAHSWDSPLNVNDVRQLGNGEIVAEVADGYGEGPSSLWVSSGFPENPTAALWSSVHTFTTPKARTAPFSWSVHDNIVVVAEYGPKATTPDNARYAYLSTDYGASWSTIFDLGGADGNHLHGVCYDPYWERIWITYGDDTNGTVFSDDLGSTWHTAHSSTDVGGAHQNTGIVALPGAVLFGSDVSPNGIHRIRRTQGKHTGPYDIDVPYTHNNVEQITHVNQLAYRRGDGPAIFYMSPGVTEGSTAFVVATLDGERFVRVWEDDYTGALGYTGTALGPTADGKLVIHQADGRHGASRTWWRGPLPSL